MSTDTRCPISWLTLEQYVLGELERHEPIEGHLSSCAECAAALRSIHDDARGMPALVITSSRLPAGRRARALSWAFGAVGVLAVAFLIFRSPREGTVQSVTRVKGGEPSLQLVRERDGALLRPTHFAPRDRFKAHVSCAAGAWFVDVVIAQGHELFYPLEAARLECGNAVAVPGAFRLSGGPLRVCAVISAKPSERGFIPPDATCLRLRPASERKNGCNTPRCYVQGSSLWL